MRKYLYSLLIAMGTSSVPLVAQECCDSCKLYLSPQDVMVSHNGIIVNIDGMAGTTDTLGHDINGLYTDSNRILWIDREGHYNPPERPQCPKCGDVNKAWQERENERKEKEKKERERANKNK